MNWWKSLVTIKFVLTMANLSELLMQHADVVDYLLQYDFNNFSYDEKLFIKNLNRPCPPLSDLINVNKKDSAGGTSYRAFNTQWYEKFVWLTGSTIRSKLFCWHCLLFGEKNSEQSPWNRVGYDDLKNIHRSAQKHAASRDHLLSTLKLKLFGKQNVMDPLGTDKQEIEKHNNLVKKNREVLKTLIDMTIYLVTQELAFRGCDEMSKSLTQKNFKEFVLFLSKYDSRFNSFLDESSAFGDLTEIIQNDLTKSINEVIAEVIEEEINQSACFSWQVDDASCFSQLSVIFRYNFQGKIVERFMGFFNFSGGHRTDDLFNFLKTKFEKFDISNKLIGQTYDGAVAISEELNALQMKVREIAPQALFVHSYVHKLNLIIHDAANKIEECRIFFANLVGISSFFHKSTKRAKVLEDVGVRWLPSSSEPIHWNFISKLIQIILNNRSSLIEVFDIIVNSEVFQRDHDTIREAMGLKSMLNDFNSLFLLQVFNLIFQHTDITFSEIENKLSDTLHCVNIIESLLSTLKSYKIEESYFINMYRGIVDILGPPPKRIKTEFDDPTDDGSMYFINIFNEILNLAIHQIDIRFKHLQQLKFFDLLNITKLKFFERNFQSSLDLLISNYPNLFEKAKLQIELRVLYSEASLLGKSENASFQNMLNYIYSNDLQSNLSEVYKLLSLILSLPVTSARVENGTSLLERIKHFCKNLDGGVHLNNSSTISIERNLVKSLQKDKQFYEKIIDNFAFQKNREMELFYKPL